MRDDDARLGEFEDAVLGQTAVRPDAYDAHYFRGAWREGDNRYDAETRRAVEGRHPALIASTFDPSSTLDVGCGPGHLMVLLSEIGIVADGIDFSPHARALAHPSVASRISHGDVTELPVEPRSYELVICREVIEHLTVLEVRRVVPELCRISARFVYLTTRFHPDPNSFIGLTDEPDVDITHITLLSKRLLRVLFVLEGFRSRADLEVRLDWRERGRVLVYERTDAAR